MTESLLSRVLLAESDRETEKLKKAQRGIPDARNEKRIQASCVRVLKQLGFRCWNLSQVRASKQSPGLGDVFLCGHGVTAWVEFKTRLGQQSRHQIDFGDAVRRNGGTYLLVRSEADVIEWARPIVNRTATALNRIPLGHATWTEP